MMKKYSFLILLTLFVSQLMAQNVPSYVPKNGLVGWWPFNGNATDESGNGNNGTVNGATLSADRDGKVNSAYSFDGISNYIRILNSNNLNPSSFTISSWINPKSYASNVNDGAKAIITKWYGQLNCNNYGDNYNVQISLIDNRNVLVGATSVNNQVVNSANTNLNELNKWINFIFIHDEKNGQKIFYNGKLVFESKQIGSLCQTKNDLLFGADSYINKVNRFFNGQIDDIAIYNRALSDQEVKQLYQACTKETATSSNFSNIILSNSSPINLTAIPSGGTFSGKGISNNIFTPSKSNIGKQTIKYNFMNSSSCKDSTIFNPIVYDTVGNICKVTSYDTILKLKFKLTTGINANQMTSMTLYPNPTTDVLYIEIGDAKALDGYRYRILDAVGKEVYNQLVKNPKTEIPLKSLGAAGMYLFEVIDQQNKTIQSNKIVLE